MQLETGLLRPWGRAAPELFDLMRRYCVFCPIAGGCPAPAGGLSSGMHPPLSSSQSPLSSVSLAVTSSASLVPAMLARTRSLRCSGSPHRAGRGGGPNAKTAPAPLHPRGTSAPTPWAWALLLSPPRGARRGPLSVLAEKKTGRTRKGYAASVSGKAANGCAIARSKRKGRLGALRCSGPPRDGGRRIGACSDLGLPSGTLGSSAKSMLPSRGGWCRPRRGGHRIDQLLFSLPLAAPRGNWYNGRMRASAPTGKW